MFCSGLLKGIRGICLFVILGVAHLAFIRGCDCVCRFSYGGRVCFVTSRLNGLCASFDSGCLFTIVKDSFDL